MTYTTMHNEASDRVKLACYNDPENVGPYKHIATIREITNSVFTGPLSFCPRVPNWTDA